MSLKPEDVNSKLTDLDESKIKILDDWQKVEHLTHWRSKVILDPKDADGVTRWDSHALASYHNILCASIG